MSMAAPVTRTTTFGRCRSVLGVIGGDGTVESRRCSRGGGEVELLAALAPPSQLD